jgi:cytochrome c553
MKRAMGLAAALFAAGGAFAQNTAQAVATQVCAACHGADGNSVAPANPKIAGQIPEYLQKQLLDFKSQEGKKPVRESAIMNGMVANLSDADMKGLAAYYAGQSQKPAAAADKDLAALGQKLLRGLSRPGGRRDPGAVPAALGPVRRIRCRAAHCLSRRQAHQRSQRRDAWRCRAHERWADPRRRRIRGRPEALAE